MDIGIILLGVSYAYLLSALVRFVISRNKPSPEEERKNIHKQKTKLYTTKTKAGRPKGKTGVNNKYG